MYCRDYNDADVALPVDLLEAAFAEAPVDEKTKAATAAAKSAAQVSDNSPTLGCNIRIFSQSQSQSPSST